MFEFQQQDGMLILVDQQLWIFNHEAMLFALHKLAYRSTAFLLTYLQLLFAQFNFVLGSLLCVPDFIEF